jgi:hypothetical protein
LHYLSEDEGTNKAFASLDSLFLDCSKDLTTWRIINSEPAKIKRRKAA